MEEYQNSEIMQEPPPPPQASTPENDQGDFLPPPPPPEPLVELPVPPPPVPTEKPESKAKEFLTYLLWTIGIIFGVVIIAVVLFFLEPLLELIDFLIAIGSIILFILFIIVAAFYLLFDPERK